MMKLSHRSLLVVILLVVFFLLLYSKIEGKSAWNWFLVFGPIWVMDLLTFLLIYARKQSDNYYSNNFNQIVIYCLLAKVSFQSLLCVKLEFYQSMPIYIVMAPFWCFCIMLLCNLFQKLISSQ